MLKNIFFPRFICLFIFFLGCSFYGHTQKYQEDSILQLINKDYEDSNKVNDLTELADLVCNKRPDTALIISLDALSLAKKIGYDTAKRYMGLLNVIAKTYSKIGNFPKALEWDFKILQIEEKRKIKKPRNMAIVLMSIGNVYNNQGDYQNSLKYLFKSDSIITKHEGKDTTVRDLKYYSFVNIGDAYYRLNQLSSAFLYSSKAKKEADSLNNNYFIGASQLVLAHIYRKQSVFAQSKNSYLSAINLLRSEDEELLCEAYLGLGNLYDSLHNSDSAVIYSKRSYLLAKKDGFPSKQLEAAKFLREVYSRKNIDSAYAYAMFEKDLNDTLNSSKRIKELQIISSNEVTRQKEMAEAKRQAEKEWRNRLQQLLIGIFIPGLFLFTLLLRKVNLHIRLIKLLGIFSLLFFFEYLTLFLHPTVSRLTNHTPVYEILVFVGIAAILIPLHHKAEHWLIHKLLHHRIHHHDK